MIAVKQIFVATNASINTQFLCFTAEEANSTISMSAVGSAPTVYLETSPTGEYGSWSDFTVGSTTITLENAGDKVYFRAKQDNERFATSNSNYNEFVMTGKIAASGNLNTLLKADGSIVDLTGRGYCFMRMFNGCTSLTKAPELPATTLASNCYTNMFNSCKSLTKAPELPATKLANTCYYYMFRGCTSLTNAPELPATTLTTNCYSYMFSNCLSLAKAPELPAKKLATNCYQKMFSGCTQIDEIKTSQTSFDNCNEWLNNVSESGTFYCPSALGTNETISRGISACPNGWSVVNTDVLCFTAEEAVSTISMSAVGSAPTVYLETSPTGVEGSWTDFTVGSTTITLANVGNKVYFRAKQDNNVFATGSSQYNQFVMTGKIAASGNINTLLKADGSVDDLSTRDYCYYSMFRYCTSLTKAPELPATTLANSCYSNMFRYCTSLTKAPELPATTLARSCYSDMFEGCTSLTQAPALPATSLASSCYYYMFEDCTSLTQAPALPATSLASSCYGRMFYGCTSLTKAPELPATTLASNCYYSMFDGCTSLTKAPELPATTLADSCYQNMFQGCTSLTSAPELPATTLADSCYSNMFRYCTSLTQAPELPATTLAGSCYSSMFYRCSSLTKAPELPATTLSGSCYTNMFRDCTTLSQAPELPATSLAANCYSHMFNGCTQLNEIKTAQTSFENCNNWLSGVSETGSFYCPYILGTNDTIERGVSACPVGWNVVNI